MARLRYNYGGYRSETKEEYVKTMMRCAVAALAMCAPVSAYAEGSYAQQVAALNMDVEEIHDRVKTKEYCEDIDESKLSLCEEIRTKLLKRSGTLLADIGRRSVELESYDGSEPDADLLTDIRTRVDSLQSDFNDYAYELQ
jgi:hypothetical protein